MNYILMIIGCIIAIIGIGALINPFFSRLINLPGNPSTIKSVLTILIGFIIIIVSITSNLI